MPSVQSDVLRMIRTFLPNFNLCCTSFRVRRPFLCECPYLKFACRSTRRTVSSLTVGDKPALTFTLLTVKYPISLHKMSVCLTMLRRFLMESFEGLPLLFFRLSIAVCPNFFFMCRHMVAFENFS